MPPRARLRPRGPVIRLNELRKGDILAAIPSDYSKMPHVTFVDLGPMLKPMDVGLKAWTFNINIPETFKEYVPPTGQRGLPSHQAHQHVPEVLSPEQKSILKQYVENQKKKAGYSDKSTQPRARRKSKPEPIDDTLVDEFVRSDRIIRRLEKRQALILSPQKIEARKRITSKNSPLVALNSDNIPICAFSHQIQPESVIAERALDKMHYLSLAEERKFRSLIEDRQFMDMLNHNVQLYVRNLAREDGDSETTEIDLPQ